MIQILNYTALALSAIALGINIWTYFKVKRIYEKIEERYK